MLHTGSSLRLHCSNDQTHGVCQNDLVALSRTSYRSQTYQNPVTEGAYWPAGAFMREHMLLCVSYAPQQFVMPWNPRP